MNPVELVIRSAYATISQRFASSSEAFKRIVELRKSGYDIVSYEIKPI